MSNGERTTGYLLSWMEKKARRRPDTTDQSIGWGPNLTSRANKKVVVEQKREKCKLQDQSRRQNLMPLVPENGIQLLRPFWHGSGLRKSSKISTSGLVFSEKERGGNWSLLRGEEE